MNLKKKYLLLCPLLIVFWFFPLIGNVISPDADFFRSAAACLLFLAAVLLCRLLPNRHAALVSALVLGVALCVLWPVALYDILPVLLLCGWLRCYREYEAGASVAVYFEVITDLIYACLIAAVVRLIGSGYSFSGVGGTVVETFPDLCLMALAFLFFLVLFLAGKGSRVNPPAGAKGKDRKSARAGKGVAGLVPLLISPRTFWALAALLLAACLAQYTNGSLPVEASLYFRAGFRVQLFPWGVLLFQLLDGFLPEIAASLRSVRR